MVEDADGDVLNIYGGNTCNLAWMHARVCRTDQFCCNTKTKSFVIKAVHVVNTVLMLNVMEIKQVFLTVSKVTCDESISES